MLNIAKRNGVSFLFFSSSEIYGDPVAGQVPTPETYNGNVSSMGPRAVYDEGKRSGEALCYTYHEFFDVQTKIVRPFNVYGPGMSEQDYRVLPSFASKIITNKPLAVYGSGTQTRTFSYITDAITGFLKTLLKGRPGEVYNIGNDNPEVSMLDLVKHIERVLGREIPIETLSYPDGYPGDEPRRRCPDLSKAKAELGYQPQVGIEDGLKRFFKWTESHYLGVSG